MKYINCGVLDAVTRKRITRKKRLRELAPSEPAQLLFDPTNIFDEQGSIRGDSVPPYVALSVDGPVPYTNRRRWGQVRIKDDKLVVK